MTESLGRIATRRPIVLDWKIERSSSLEPIRSVWEALAIRVDAPPCLSADFVASAIETLSRDPVWLVCAYENDRPVVAGVMCRSGPLQWTTFQPSQMPLGPWLMDASLSWESVLCSLTRSLPGLAILCGISQQDPALNERPVSSGILRQDEYIETAYIDVAGPFGDFWEARGKNLKQNARKQRKKLAENGTPPELEVVEDPEKIAEAFKEFVKLESASWKQSMGSAVTEDSGQARFYQKVLVAQARRGMGFVVIWRIGGQVAAVDLCVADGRQVVILKTTYDESLQGISPGQLMHEELFRHLFDVRKTSRIEFLGRVMEWHKRWTEQSRTLYHVTYFRSAPIRWVRDLLRRSRRPAQKAVSG